MAGWIGRRSFMRVAEYVGDDLFIRLLKMLIMPLIISSVIVGVASVGDFSRLGRIGLQTVVYCFSTTIIAVVIGICLVTIIKPGMGFFEGAEGEARRQADLKRGQAILAEVDRVPAAQGIRRPATTAEALLGVLKRIIPDNPIRAASDGEPLPTIAFSIVFGILLTTLSDRAKPVITFFQVIMDVMIKMTNLVLWFAPVGVFFLVGKSVADVGAERFAERIGTYMVTVPAGLGLHAIIVLPLILALVGRANPLRLLFKVKEALLMALSTSSSSPSLPVTLNCAIDKAGCSRKAARFVLPLGSTINMDGTALYEAVAVIFLAQAFSPATLSTGDLFVISLTATLAAVGAAGIPSAGVTTMVLVITAVNDGGTVYIPLAGVGVILAVDRILDMCRTTVNVWGDLVGARVLTRFNPDDASSLG